MVHEDTEQVYKVLIGKQISNADLIAEEQQDAKEELDELRAFLTGESDD